MSEVSTFRLYLVRAMYVFTAVGLAIEKLPALLHPANLSPTDGVVLSVLGATALLAVVGSVTRSRCCRCSSSSSRGSPSGSWLSGCPCRFPVGWIRT